MPKPIAPTFLSISLFLDCFLIMYYMYIIIYLILILKIFICLYSLQLMMDHDVLKPSLLGRNRQMVSSGMVHCLKVSTVHFDSECFQWCCRYGDDRQHCGVLLPCWLLLICLMSADQLFP